MEETKNEVVFIEYNSDEILKELSEARELIEKLERTVCKIRRKVCTVKIVEAPERTDASK